jgi:hypothetical protein
MDESYVRNELFDKATEVGEFEVFPAPSEAEEDLDNAFLISTGILLGVPKMFIVRVEEFTTAKRRGTKRQTRYSKNRSGTSKGCFLSTQSCLAKRPGTRSSPTPCGMFIPLGRAGGFQRMRCAR